MGGSFGGEALPLEAVELHKDYEHMLVVVTADGARWFYLQYPSGVLELGRPFIDLGTVDGRQARVHLWAPLAPGSLPRVLKVELL